MTSCSHWSIISAGTNGLSCVRKSQLTPENGFSLPTASQTTESRLPSQLDNSDAPSSDELDVDNSPLPPTPMRALSPLALSLRKLAADCMDLDLSNKTLHTISRGSLRIPPADMAVLDHRVGDNSISSTETT
jgi:hypothetical protein